MNSCPCLVLAFLCSYLFFISKQEQYTHKLDGSSQIAIVSTVDGLLHGLQISNGKLLWSTHVINDEDAKNLVSSTLDKIHIFDENDGYVRIIPSLKGDLFKWNGESLDQFPTNADMLLSRSTKLTENTFASGAIAVHTLSVNARNGKVNYRCNGNEPCRHDDEPSEKTAPDEPVEEPVGEEESVREMLLVRSTERTVRAVDELSGAERWNFSVIDVDIKYSASEKKNSFNHYISPNPPIDTLFNTASNQHSQCVEVHNQLRVMTPEGAIFGLDKDGQLSWTHKFDAPVGNVWKYDCESLVKLDLSDSNLVPDLQSSVKSPNPSLYLGSFANMWYVQIYRAAEPTTVHAGPLIGSDMFVQRKITWVPYLATSPSRTPYLNQENANIRLDESSIDVFSLALMPIDNEISYPYDAGYSLPQQEIQQAKSIGFYFVTDELDYFKDVVLPRIEGTKTSDWAQKDESSFLDSGQILAFVPVSLSYYWRQIVALTLFFGVILNILFHYLRKLKENCDADCCEEEEEEIHKEEETPVEVAETQEIVASLEPPKVSAGFNDNFRFLQKLGKGGFGSVYVAQHKLDLQRYAIKRIELPRKTEAADKMRREVRALSRLNHGGIVRYYNSWEESIKSQEADILGQLNSKDTAAEDYSYDNGFASASLVSTDTQNPCLISNLSEFKSSELNGTRDALGSKGDAVDDRFNTESSLDDLIVFKASTLSELKQKNQNGAHSFSKPPQYMSSIAETTSSIISKDESMEKKTPSVKNFLYIQMELCRPNTLKDWLMDELERDRNMTLHIFHQIVEAVAYLHDADQFHRDLKPSNIFFSERDAMVKIGDFGLVTTSASSSLLEMDDSNANLDRSTSVETTTNMNKSSSSSNSLKHTGKVGTRIYMSPEQRRGRVYGNKVDIYALGIILYELLQPFGTESGRIAQLKEVRELHFPPHRDTTSIYTDSDLVLIKSMLSRDPTERPSSKELVDHEILKSYEVPSQDVRMQKLSKSRSSSNCDNFSTSSPENS